MSSMLLLVFLVAAPPSAREDFNARWNDGKAELSGYRLTQPRYGQARPGFAVMVWVTEPFSKSKHLKLDRPAQAGNDRVDVMKLNLGKRFRTGIYDYSLLTSVFSPIVFDPKPRLPEKVAFSSQEWCGTVFAQLTREADGLRLQSHSYFESEGDSATSSLAADDATVLEDDLWWKLRELAMPFAPGKYGFLPSLSSARLAHAPMIAGSIELKRTGGVELDVPMGHFRTVRWDLAISWGSRTQTRTVWIEEKPPRRVIAWEGEAPSFSGANEPTLERAELTGSIRDTYWQHNHLGDEALVDKLGAVPR